MLGSPDVDPKVKTHIQLVYLGGAPKRRKWGQQDRRREEALHSCALRESSLEGNSELIPQNLCNMSYAPEFSLTLCKGIGCYTCEFVSPHLGRC